MIPNCKKISTSDLDKYYPVGSYYETSDINFDPNVSWGGTWLQDTEGLSTIAANTSEDPSLERLGNRVSVSVGEIRGEVQHVLTVNEMPSHQHTTKLIGSSLNQAAGSQNIAGYQANIFNNRQMVIYNDGIGNYTGGDTGHNNVQPSIGVIRWHRTA